MQMIPVDSETVRSVGYDARSRVLPVAFHSGGTYEYVGYPCRCTRRCRTRGGVSADWSEPTATAASRPANECVGLAPGRRGLFFPGGSPPAARRRLLTGLLTEPTAPSGT